MRQALAIALVLLSLLSNQESWALLSDCSASPAALAKKCACCAAAASCGCHATSHQAPQPSPLAPTTRSEAPACPCLPVTSFILAALQPDISHTAPALLDEPSLRVARSVPKFILHCAQLC